MKATENFLRRAANGKLDRNIIKNIHRSHDSCDSCKVHAPKSRRFKLTLGTGDTRLNHRVFVDTMFLKTRPVMHLNDEPTHFSAASFMKTQSATDTWKAILRLWLDAYMGPPDAFYVEQGSAYVSREVKSAITASGITIDEAPI